MLVRNLFSGRDTGEDDGVDIGNATTQAIAGWLAQHKEHLAHVVVHHGTSRLGRIAIEDVYPGREVEDILLDDPRFGPGTFILRARDRKDRPLSGSVTVSVGREQKRVEQDVKREKEAKAPDPMETVANTVSLFKDMGVFPAAGTGGNNSMDAVTAAILPEMFRAFQGQAANPLGQVREAVEFVQSINRNKHDEDAARFGAHSDLYDEEDDEFEDDEGEPAPDTMAGVMGELAGRFLSLLEKHMVPNAPTPQPQLAGAGNLAGVTGQLPGGGLESPNVGPSSDGPTASKGRVFEPVEVEVSAVDSMRVEMEKLAQTYDGQRWFKWMMGAIQGGTPEEVVEAIDTGIRGAKVLRYGGPVFDLLDENPGQAFDALMDFLTWLPDDPKRIETRALFLDSVEGDDTDGPDDADFADDADGGGRDSGDADADDDDVAGYAGASSAGYIRLGARPRGRPTPTWDDDDSDE